MCIFGITNEKIENPAEELFEEIMAKIFLKINERYQSTNIRNSENPK